MTQGRKILIVSGGDAGRSMMAKAIFDQKLREQNIIEMEVVARCMVILFPEPVNEKIQIVLEEHGMKLQDECMRQITQEDIDWSELIICMNEDIKEKIIEQYENVDKIACIKDLGREGGEMLDPYGKELMDYEYSFRELERIIEKIIKLYQEEEK